ncbi:MAG: TrkA family potassium uptake protein [Bacilli bacterium]|nr:TrkA family potassium uptake protein [Bacilli bacterium]
MATKKSFAVIGLGQFGLSIVNELIDNGADVIAIDVEEEAVKKIAGELPTAFVADSTDAEALKELGVHEVDAAIVAYGSNKEASVLTTVILRELGVEQIIVRVDEDSYIPIMKKLGATEVIAPQKAAGVALANRLGNVDYKDFYKIDNKYSIVSIAINAGFVPATLIELNPKIKFGVNVVLVNRNGKSFVPGGNDSLLPEDTVFVVGSTKEIKDFRESINGNGKTKSKKK